MEEWLGAIGLAERIAAFQAQGISFDQLIELTDDDLRELGLTIGERKRFRHAVAALRPGLSDDPPPSALPVLETTRAERRPLTIMFVDLVNSSSLGERLEPEDLLEVIRRYREFCGAAITRYGGHIARLVGDGILAYFCYPVANENDPERGVRAALDITRRIGDAHHAGGRTAQRAHRHRHRARHRQRPVRRRRGPPLDHRLDAEPGGPPARLRA